MLVGAGQAQLEVEPQLQDVLVVEPHELLHEQQLEVLQEHQPFMAASSNSASSRTSKVSASSAAISSNSGVMSFTSFSVMGVVADASVGVLT